MFRIYTFAYRGGNEYTTARSSNSKSLLLAQFHYDNEVEKTQRMNKREKESENFQVNTVIVATISKT